MPIAAGERVPIIADGGVRRHGGIAAALALGRNRDAWQRVRRNAGNTGRDRLKRVLMPESQKIVSVPFKVFRGMASIGAVRDRLDLEEADPRELEALGAEGLEVSVPARGSVRGIIHDMLKHLCSSISYGGAHSLSEFRQQFWSNPDRYLTRLSPASRTESFER
jgi:IMP dehydrogenase